MLHISQGEKGQGAMQMPQRLRIQQLTLQAPHWVNDFSPFHLALFLSAVKGCSKNLSVKQFYNRKLGFWLSQKIPWNVSVFLGNVQYCQRTRVFMTIFVVVVVCFELKAYFFLNEKSKIGCHDFNKTLRHQHFLWKRPPFPIHLKAHGISQPGKKNTELKGDIEPSPPCAQAAIFLKDARKLPFQKFSSNLKEQERLEHPVTCQR